MIVNVQQNAAAPQQQPGFVQPSPGYAQQPQQVPPPVQQQPEKKNSSPIILAVIVISILCIVGIVVGVVLGANPPPPEDPPTTTTTTTTTEETTTTIGYSADICSGLFDNDVDSSSSLDIKSPNYPGYYDEHTDCSKIFHSSSGEGLTFEFIVFDTESCCDYVRFFDSTETELETFNGIRSGKVTFQEPTVQVDFYSDGSVSHSGFHIQVSDGVDPSLLDNICAEPSESWVQSTMDIKSPNYPENYHGFFYCAKELHSFSNGLTFDVLDLNVNNNDNVWLSDQHGNLLQSLTEVGSIGIESSTIKLNFYSDGSSAAAGFHIQVSDGGVDSSSSNDICAGDLNNDVDTTLDIKSPNYPSNYNDNTDCAKIYHSPSGDGLTFEFFDFNTEVGFDHVHFEDSNGDHLVSLDGGHSDTLSFQEPSVRVHFTSDGGVTRTGFHIQVTDGYVSTSSSNICSGSHDNTVVSPIDIRSPNYPEPYAHNQDCSKVFHSSSDGLTFQFIDFHTEEDNDYLDFSDENGDNLESIHGTRSGMISFQQPSVHLRFHSDWSEQKSGFHIQVSDGYDPSFDTTPTHVEHGLTCPDPFNPPSISSSRIVGGHDAVQGDWPWIAHLGGCGATILTKKTDGSNDVIMTGNASKQLTAI